MFQSTRYKTIYHVVKKLRSWNHGVNQVDNFLNSKVLELVVTQTDGELLSAFGHHGLNQLAERCCKSNYLVIDWWFCQKTNTLFLLASNIFPRVRRAVPELVKLFWDIFFPKYFSIDKKQSRLHVVLLKLVQLLHGAVLETPGEIYVLIKLIYSSI